jgi:ATP-dependent helicase/nuclease subunit B
LELDLNAIGERPVVTLKNGTEIPLSGKADRVDFWQDEKGHAYLRVADYKTGTRSFDAEDIAKGFCLQMPLYLLALCRGDHKELCRRLNLPEDTVFHPAGVSYLSSAIGTENTESRRPQQDAMQDAVERLSREGLVLADTEVQHAMSLSGNKAILGGGRSKSKRALSTEEFDDLFVTLENTIADIATCMKKGDAEAHPRPHGGRTPCEYCAFSAVCRTAQKN